MAANLSSNIAKSRMILPLQHFATVTSPPNPPKGSQG
jgi:hypothetical protein